MAGFLGQVLTGLGRGYLSNMKEQRAKREDDAAWETEKKRKRETLDMQDEYQQKSEQRKRLQGAYDEEVAYQRGQKREDAAFTKQKSRLADLQNEQLAEIQKLFPDQWNNPTLQPQIIAGVKGIKVPALPPNKQIAQLAISGKIDEAMKLAVNSNNPEDRKFYDDMITMISNQKRLKNLLNPSSGGSDQQRYGFNPDAEVIQSALDQGQSAVPGLLSQVIPGMGSRPINMPSSGVSPKAAPPIDEKSVKQFKQVRDDAAKEIQMIRKQYREDPEAMKGTADEFRYQDALDRYNRASEFVNRFNDSVLNGGRSPDQAIKPNAVQAFEDMNRQFLEAGTPARKVVKSTAARQSPGILQRIFENGMDILRPTGQVAMPQAVISKPSLQGASPLPAPALSKQPSLQGVSPLASALSKQPSAQEALKVQKFNALVSTISTQLKRQLSNDERGFIASGIYDGNFDDLVFDFNEGTFTKPGANSKRPAKDLIDSNIGDFAAENGFQFIPNVRSTIANALRGSFLTDKGADAFGR